MSERGWTEREKAVSYLYSCSMENLRLYRASVIVPGISAQLWRLSK